MDRRQGESYKQAITTTYGFQTDTHTHSLSLSLYRCEMRVGQCKSQLGGNSLAVMKNFGYFRSADAI